MAPRDGNFGREPSYHVCFIRNYLAMVYYWCITEECSVDAEELPETRHLVYLEIQEKIGKNR
jgi:hypothetical protein